jgi:hypothetical protein
MTTKHKLDEIASDADYEHDKKDKAFGFRSRNALPRQPHIGGLSKAYLKKHPYFCTDCKCQHGG